MRIVYELYSPAFTRVDARGKRTHVPGYTYFRRSFRTGQRGAIRKAKRTYMRLRPEPGRRIFLRKLVCDKFYTGLEVVDTSDATPIMLPKHTRVNDSRGLRHEWDEFRLVPHW